MTSDVVTGLHNPGELAFDPVRDGFGFRNPVGEVAIGNGRGPLLRRLGAILYGKGLCFGMVTMALRRFAEQPADASERPLAGLPPTPELLGEIRRYHVRQYMPRAVLAAVKDWLRSRGGKPDSVLRRLRLAGTDSHLICFGPAVNRRFLWCLMRAHAVAPYRVETENREARVYVYDPNYPGDRGRYVNFRRDGSGRAREFEYEGFGTRWGWGISLFPHSAIGDTARHGLRAIP
ncbi:MAG TPA: hypothetical protein VHM69_05755 [Rubrobacter sp.]|nr:hypothetical protein [Rubrobacter sp.]